MLNDVALIIHTNASASLPMGIEIDLPPVPLVFTTNIVFIVPARTNTFLSEPSGFPLSLTFKGQHGLLSQLDWNVASNFCQTRGLLRIVGPTNFNGHFFSIHDQCNFRGRGLFLH